MSETVQSELAEMATELVAAHVSNNSVPTADLPGLIVSVHDALRRLGQPVAVELAAEPLKLAVPVKRSLTDDYIISLEDGRKLKSMKRYLSGLGLTPAEYRSKWNLPADDPLVAPSYAARRSELAKSLGLGRRTGQGASDTAPEVDEPEAELAAAEPPKPGRKRKKAA